MDREKKQFAWWYYFWFLVVLTVFTAFFFGRDLDYAFLAFDTMGLVGLWAYLRRRPVVSRYLWRLYFVGMCAVFAYTCTTLLPLKHVFPVEDHIWLSILIGGWFFTLLVMLPLFIALWRYSFRSHEIWRQVSGAA